VSRFIAMRKRQKLKTQRKHKKHVARTPAAVAKFKERFLKQLALGRSPGVAARGVGIARSTAYGWKREDREFDAAWVDAVETSLDKLETELYDIAKEDPDNIASRLRAIELVEISALWHWWVAYATSTNQFHDERHDGRTFQTLRTSRLAEA
jgi:hypothetical protein